MKPTLGGDGRGIVGALGAWAVLWTLSASGDVGERWIEFTFGRPAQVEPATAGALSFGESLESVQLLPASAPLPDRDVWIQSSIDEESGTTLLTWMQGEHEVSLWLPLNLRSVPAGLSVAVGTLRHQLTLIPVPGVSEVPNGRSVVVGGFAAKFQGPADLSGESRGWLEALITAYQTSRLAWEEAERTRIAQAEAERLAQELIDARPRAITIHAWPVESVLFNATQGTPR